MSQGELISQPRPAQKPDVGPVMMTVGAFALLAAAVLMVACPILAQDVNPDTIYVEFPGLVSADTPVRTFIFRPPFDDGDTALLSFRLAWEDPAASDLLVATTEPNDPSLWFNNKDNVLVTLSSGPAFCGVPVPTGRFHGKLIVEAGTHSNTTAYGYAMIDIEAVVPAASMERPLTFDKPELGMSIRERGFSTIVGEVQLTNRSDGAVFFTAKLVTYEIEDPEHVFSLVYPVAENCKDRPTSALLPGGGCVLLHIYVKRRPPNGEYAGVLLIEDAYGMEYSVPWNLIVSVPSLMTPAAIVVVCSVPALILAGWAAWLRRKRQSRAASSAREAVSSIVQAAANAGGAMTLREVLVAVPGATSDELLAALELLESTGRVKREGDIYVFLELI